MGLQTEQLEFFAKFIEKELGIVYGESNFFQLEHRLNEIVIQLGLPNLEDLWIKAKQGIEGNFKALLLDIATNNETSFFRDVAVFNALEKSIIPTLMEEDSALRTVKIWSAACSSGQEPYSIAMTMELAKSQNPSWPSYQIQATDFSDRMLVRSKSRTYSQLEVQRGLSAKNLVNFFENGTEPNTWTLKNTISPSHFQFDKINLLTDWSFPQLFHVVFCRNVLIYQNVENKIKVVERIANSLLPGGYLLLGAAESMLGISNRFEQMHFENAVFYKKKS